MDDWDVEEDAMHQERPNVVTVTYVYKKDDSELAPKRDLK